MKPNDKVRVIPGPPDHLYTGCKIGQVGVVTERVSSYGKSIAWVKLKGDDEPEEWWVEYLEVVRR